MVDRLDAVDVSFLYLEAPTAPTQVGSVAVFEPPAEGFDYDTVLALVRDRLALVPRYRQRVRWVPGHLANPVWVDDDQFDLSYHVRQSAVPRPGTDAQLRELVGHIFSRPLDRARPLWELYVVEGLESGRIAIVAKTHQAVIDGVATVDIGQVILDDQPTTIPAIRPGSIGAAGRSDQFDSWKPAQPPSSVELFVDAVGEVVRRPTAALDAARGVVTDLRMTTAKVAGAVTDLGESVASVTGRVTDAVGGLAGAVVRATRPAPLSPLNVPIGAHRRYATVETRLEDYRRVRAKHGGSVNDVILATIAGALRSWFMTRGLAVRTTTSVRAMVPVSVRDDAPDETADRSGPPGPNSPNSPDSPNSSNGRAVPAGGLGSRVAAYVVDLPVGEPSPVMRLHQVSYAMTAHHEGGKAVGASALVGLTGFAPPTLHALGARVAGSLSRRIANVVITNVPGPQNPLYAGPARMVATYPVVPLAKDQALAIGLTSYDGAVRFGLTGDRDAMADLDVLAQCIPDAIRELLDAAGCD